MANVFNMGGGTDLVSATLKPGFPIIYSDGNGSHEETPSEEKTVAVLGSSIVYAPYGLSGEVTPLDRAGFWFVTGDFTAQTSVPVASITPSSGVVYGTGISDLDPSLINSIARAISNNSSITYETEVVYIDMVNFHRKISIGDTVSIALDDAVHEFRILGFNSNSLFDSTAYGSVTLTGAAGLTFEMVTVYSTPSRFTEKGRIQDTTRSEYTPAKAVIYTTTLPRIKAGMDSSWRTHIKSVERVYSTEKENETHALDLFLLRSWDFGVYDTHIDNGDGKLYTYKNVLYPYAYYMDKDSTKRKKQTPLGDTNISYFTETTAVYQKQKYNMYPVLVNSSGDFARAETLATEYYIAPLFCI